MLNKEKYVDGLTEEETEDMAIIAEISTIQDFEVEKPQTNADRIRNMTDEELLDFLCSIETYDEGSVKTIEGGVAMCSVTEVKQWLKKARNEDAG